MPCILSCLSLAALFPEPMYRARIKGRDARLFVSLLSIGLPNWKILRDEYEGKHALKEPSGDRLCQFLPPRKPS
jgi:hypothetical protein